MPSLPLDCGQHQVTRKMTCKQFAQTGEKQLDHLSLQVPGSRYNLQKQAGDAPVQTQLDCAGQSTAGLSPGQQAAFILRMRKFRSHKNLPKGSLRGQNASDFQILSYHT